MRSKETGYIKSITDSEFKLLLEYAIKRHSRPFLVCFKCMAYLGLRVGDATKLRLSSLNSECSELTYEQQKTKVIQTKQIPRFFQIELGEYISQYRGLMRDGYLFPPLHNLVSKRPHLRPATFRCFFRDFRRVYGYDKPYHICRDGKRLYRISPHTLKHYCLYKVYLASDRDLSFTQLFSGHKEVKHCLRYLMHQDNLYRQAEVLERAFG